MSLTASASSVKPSRSSSINGSSWRASRSSAAHVSVSGAVVRRSAGGRRRGGGRGPEPEGVVLGPGRAPGRQPQHEEPRPRDDASRREYGPPVLLTPRYGDHPVVSVELPMADPHPLVGQRRRLESLLRELSDEQWQHPSRCEGWTVQDVITHLNSTNAFWGFSIAQGLAGEPTRFLADLRSGGVPGRAGRAGPRHPTERHARGVRQRHRGAGAGRRRPRRRGLERPGGGAAGPPAASARSPTTPSGTPGCTSATSRSRSASSPPSTPTRCCTCLHYAVALGRAFALCQGSSEQGSVDDLGRRPGRSVRGRRRIRPGARPRRCGRHRGP